MIEHQTISELLKKHIEWAGVETDFCEQCIRPWNDGICTCGNSNHKRVIMARQLAMGVIANGKGEGLNSL